MEKKTTKTKHNFFQKLNTKRKKLALTVGMFIAANMMTAISAFASSPNANNSGGGGGGLNDTVGKTQFDELIGFFATWIGRIGGVIALVGAVMFGFANKSEDPEGKQRGVNTMVSGIIVFAVSQAADWFTSFA